MKKHLIEFYIEWMNDWYNVRAMAEWHGLSYEETNKLIDLGRKLNHELIELRLKKIES